MQGYKILGLGASAALVGGMLGACTPPGRVRPASLDAGGQGGVKMVSGAAGAGGPGDSGEAGAGLVADTGVAGTGVVSDTGEAGSGMVVGPPETGAAGSSGSVCVSSGFSSPGGRQPVIPSDVTTALTPVPPISGGTLLILADGSTAIASDPDRDQVYVVDLPTKFVRTVALQAGDEPGRIAEDGAGRIHVALRRGGAVVTIDRTLATVTARQAVCTAPRGLAYQADLDLVHVACAGGELVSLPAAGGAPTRSVLLDRDLRDVLIGPNGALLVSTFRRAEVLVVGSNGTVTSRLRPGSGGMSENRTPSVAWRMLSLDETAGSVIMLHQTGGTAVVNTSHGGYGQGSSACGGIVQAGVSVLSAGASPPPVAAGISMASLTVDLALSPNHDLIALAIPGNAETPMIPTLVTTTLSAFEDAASDTCVAVVGFANPPPGQVVAVSYSPSGTLYAQTREPAALWSSAGATISLASDTRADTGHLIFHANAGGGIACASCHPEGGEDGRVWTFDCGGPRRTQSIRGDIGPTAPFHWDGSEPDFPHLIDDVFTGRMAGPILDADQKDALASWIKTIPALPKTAGLDAAAVARGAMLFEDPKVGCSACHAGSLLTNDATVDVGTGQAFQVPSLRGVSWRAPFMHNGCAATLADRFGDPTCTGGDKHGLTSTLTPAQICDLTAYLESL